MTRRATEADWPEIEAIQAGASGWSGYRVWIAECESRVAGFLVTREVAHQEHEILEVAVAATVRRRGLASELIRHAIRDFPGAYFLEVRQSNEAARQLYCKLGFNAVGLRENYYSNPAETAIVMRFHS